MRTSQLAIIKKDLRTILQNKRYAPILALVPMVFTIFIPTIFILGFYFAPESSSEFEVIFEMFPNADGSVLTGMQVVEIFVNYILPIFFVIIPIMAASITAASSFVGEKEKRTLETLLYGPLSLQEIFLAKVFSSFMLSLIVCYLAFGTLVAWLSVLLHFTFGQMVPFGWNWLVTLLLVAPSVSLVSITFIVKGSAKAQTMEESQQRAGFLVLPVMLLIIGQFTGLLLINAWILIGVAVVFFLLAAVLLITTKKQFTYENLLK